MNRIGWVLGVCAALLIPSISRADDPPPGFDMMRIEFVPAVVGGLTDEKDQVSFTVNVVDGTNFKSFPQTYVELNFDGSNGAPLMIRAPACSWPFFMVTVQNKSDQILKLRSSAAGGEEIVIVIEDEQGGTLDAVRKKKLLEASGAGRPAWTERTTDPQKSAARFAEAYRGMVERLPMLRDDASILPGRKANFVTCFDYVPGAQKTSEIDDWFLARKEMTLGFFDVPVSRDTGGAVKKKSSYQIRLLVKVWKDRYEYVAREETKSWTPVVKSSSLVRDAVSAPGPDPAPAPVGAPGATPVPK